MSAAEALPNQLIDAAVFLNLADLQAEIGWKLSRDTSLRQRLKEYLHTLLPAGGGAETVEDDDERWFRENNLAMDI